LLYVSGGAAADYDPSFALARRRQQISRHVIGRGIVTRRYQHRFTYLIYVAGSSVPQRSHQQQQLAEKSCSIKSN